LKDSLLIDAAMGEANNALDMLRGKPPLDPVARRRQMAQAAKAFNRASRILTEWEAGLELA
jgi:hypothetical protein